MKRALLEAVVEARAEKRPVVVLTPLGPEGEARLWLRGDGALPPDLRDAAERALTTDQAATVETANGAVFLNPINPPLKLVIVGAVHIAEPLASMATLLGYAVTIVDPREGYTRADRWPSGVVVSTEWPDESRAVKELDHRTAVVTLSHDPKIDDPALEAALRSPAFYVGALGSKRSHAKRLERLAAQGVSGEALARVHGPAGLAIGARSPAEIALSIVSQMTEVLRSHAD
jgi:xanthine dehydrogenase accessory factor